MSRSSLHRAIAAGSTLVLDSSAVLAYLDGGELVSGAATEVIDGLIRSGRNPGLISSVTVTETLVRPFRSHAMTAVGTVEAFLTQFPSLVIVPIDYAVAREAARVRALTELSTADSLVVATALIKGVDVLVGNDERWRSALAQLNAPVALCLLADHGLKDLISPE